MKLYLSSFHLGARAHRLPDLFGDNKRVGYVPNALDCYLLDEERRQEKIDMLRAAGLEPETLDLQQYFGDKNSLRERLGELGGVFVQGGNTFVLRQAMKLSGFDELFEELKERDDFVYSGYSAGICVLAPSLEGLGIVDDPTQLPYKQITEPIFEGLGYLDYMPLPHYQSDHPESADIDKEVAFCEEQGIPYRALRDGEDIIIE